MKTPFLIFGLLLSLLTLSHASATSVLPLNLEQLSTRANLIFHAEVISNEVKRDAQSGQIATYTEFRIIDAIKGVTGATHTIKQIGGRHETSKITMRVHGVPKFQTGMIYVVFLPKKSSLGFSSPLGLHQGSFSVLTIDDEQVVTNGRNLLRQTPATAKTNTSSVQVPLAVKASNPRQSRLDDFMNTVRAYNAQ
ncbi:MAG: hypothetical protein COA54_00420 [Thiotrichaceae bacterium]|nr:MAG: hypothetical protein COA54_00420 [Thiotrichaceae bacterium]